MQNRKFRFQILVQIIVAIGLYTAFTNCSKNIDFEAEVKDSRSESSMEPVLPDPQPIVEVAPLETSTPVESLVAVEPLTPIETLLPEPIPTKSPEPVVVAATPKPTPTLTPKPTAIPVTNSEIFGTVTNALNGFPLNDVNVTLTSASHSDFSPQKTTTSSNGTFSFTHLEAGTYQLKFVSPGFITYKSPYPVIVLENKKVSANASLSPNLSGDKIRIVLTWADKDVGIVQDMDSYLAVPGSSSPVFFSNRKGDGAELDVDNKNWNGPETITINNQLPGVYTYYVANYSHGNLPYALGKSKVKVTVYRNSEMVQEHQILAGYGIVYKLFTIDKGIIKNQNQYLPNNRYQPKTGWCITEGLKFWTYFCSGT